MDASLRRSVVASPFLSLLGLSLVGLLLIGCGNSERDPAEAPRSTADIQTDTAARTAPLDEPFAVPANLSFETMSGDRVEIGPSDGGVQIINFWATWCAPCLKEIPDLNELQTKLGPHGLEVIGIANKQGLEEVRPFADEHGISYPVVADSTGEADKQLGPIYVLPTSLVVTSDDTVRYQIPGIFPADALEDELRDLLGAPADTAAAASSAQV